MTEKQTAEKNTSEFVSIEHLSDDQKRLLFFPVESKIYPVHILLLKEKEIIWELGIVKNLLSKDRKRIWV